MKKSNAAPKTEETLVLPKANLHSLAVEAYGNADGDIKLAKESLMARLLNDQRLLTEIIESALASAVGGSLHKVATRHRAQIIKTAEAPQETAAKRANVIALSMGLQASYLDWPLANGMKLRNACRGDLLNTINTYSAQATSLTTRAAWLNLVMQSLPDDATTVGQRLSEERLTELYNEVSKS